MKTIKIDKEKLLKKLLENRAKHISEYKEALEGWRITCVNELTEALKLATAGHTEFKTHIKSPKPTDYSENYDKAISMLEWTNDTVIELEHHEFDQYVNDNWSFTGGFKSINSAYLSVK